VPGISLGAHTALHAAVQCRKIQALALEGIGPNCLEDHGGKPTTLRRRVNYPTNWLTYKLADAFSRSKPESNMSVMRKLE